MSVSEFPLTWRKSSRSAHNGSCVEAASPASGLVLTRDSKVPDGPTLSCTVGEWTALLTAVRGGNLR